MARWAEAAGLPKPEILEIPGAVVARFQRNPFGKTTGKMHDTILTLLASEPSLSIPEIAQRIGKGPRATERIIRTLREAGRLRRIGPAKGGHWQVIECARSTFWQPGAGPSESFRFAGIPPYDQPVMNLAISRIAGLRSADAPFGHVPAPC
jgi:ATP-dependent DNA helicase RecG